MKTQTFIRTATFRLDGATRDKDGYLLIDANLSKTGVFNYQDSRGRTIKELRPDDEVFNEDSLETYLGAPITVKHPSSFVTPKNHNLLSVGTVLSAKADPPYVTGRMKITDARTIKRVESGELVEVSLGYHLDLEPSRTDGADRIQRNIKVNHAALLPLGEGRLGTDVKLMRLDAANQLIIEDDLMTDIDNENTASEADKERLDADLVETEEQLEASSEESTTEEGTEEKKTEDAEEPEEEAPMEEEAPEAEAPEAEASGEESAEEPAEEAPEEPAEEEEVSMDSRFAALDAKLDAILDALSPKQDSETASNTDSNDDIESVVEARVARTLRIRRAHNKLCPTSPQDGRSDRELAVEAITRIDSKFEAKEESVDALVQKAELVAKATKEEDSKTSLRDRILGYSHNADGEGSFRGRLSKHIDGFNA